MNKLDKYIDQVKQLPPAPTVVVELLELFKEPDRDLDRVVELIGLEPALTAQILKQCNSAFFAGDEPIADMFGAVSRLGFYEVYCMVVGLFGSRTLTLPTGDFLSPDELWRHSMATAVAAAAIARRTESADATAFTSGLLHDVGKLVFAAAETARYRPVLQASGGAGLALVQVEQTVLGADHAQLGARLLERWKLPREVVAAVRCHHHPRAAGDHLHTAATVNLANALARHLEADSEEAPPSLPEAEESVRILQLAPNSIVQILKDARRALERAKALMGMKN